MAEQDLDGPQVGTVLQQVGRKAVPKRVHGDVLVQPGGEARRLAGFIHGLGGSAADREHFPGRAMGWPGSPYGDGELSNSPGARSANGARA